MHKINLAEKLAALQEHWSPRIIGELNGQHVKLAKLKGEFIWHRHDNEDELFLILTGRLRMQFRTGQVVLEPGEMIIVPKGVEHCPIADEDTSVLLFEPAGTLNTGNVRNTRTIENPARI